jgi:hypothetical protein
VEDIPAIFASEIVERFDLTEDSPPPPWGVVVAGIVSFEDVKLLIA